MTIGCTPYPAMKPSGVEWLGEVPEHWQIVPNRALLRLKKELVGSNSDDYLLLSLTKRGVVARNMENPEGKFPTQFDSYQVIEPGDLIFCLFDIDETPRTVGLSSLHGMITGAYTRFVCADETARRFVYLLYVALDNGKHLKPLYTGLRKVITKSTFLSAKMPLPSPPEQAAIVRYLDHADRRIRRYIRAKQKLIKLLEEQKQSLIHQIVTRGLDPNVRLKPSGVEWLGDVPEHWNLVPLKWASHRSQNGVTPPTSESRFYEDGEIPWYGPSSCGTKEEVGAPVRHLNPITFSEGAARLVRGAAILIVVIGATAGRMALMSDDGSTNQQVTAFEFSRDLVSPVFLLRQLRSAESWLRATASTATIPILDSGVVARLPCAMPPMEEQGVINRDLDSHVSRIDPVIVRYLTEISLLREYRTRLIADVVTGKLDVREAVARLPDEDEEPEPLDETDTLINGEEAVV